MTITHFGTLFLLSSALIGFDTLARERDVAEKLTDLIEFSNSARGNGDAALFAFNKDHFNPSTELTRLNQQTQTYRDCGFIFSEGATENIAQLKSEKNSANLKDLKKTATILTQMNKRKELVTILRAEWDGIETLNTSKENCAVSIYKIFGSDGSALSLTLTATE